MRDVSIEKIASATEHQRRSKDSGASLPTSWVALVREAANAGDSEGAIAAASGLSLGSVLKVRAEPTDREPRGPS